MFVFDFTEICSGNCECNRLQFFVQIINLTVPWMSVDRKLQNVTFSKIYPKIQVYYRLWVLVSCFRAEPTSNDQKHSMLLGNTFQPFNIRLKPVCNRYERFWTQESPCQNYAYFCKNPYFAFSDQRKCTGPSSMRLTFESVAKSCRNHHRKFC